MATPSSQPFASPDAPGDAVVVLVLLESSPNMNAFRDNLQNYYLPTLFRALQAGSPDTPIRIYWQTTADTVGQPILSSAATQLSQYRFGATAPLSIAAMRRAVEGLRAVHPDPGGRATRHLLVIAASPPQNPANFTLHGGHAPEAATRDYVLTALRQERIRVHMVLGTSPRFQVLRDFHRQILRTQISVEAPVWFPVDPTQISFHLAAKPAALQVGGAGGPLLAHGATTVPPKTEPVTPTTTAAPGLPVTAHSPQKASPASQAGAATSPTRRTRGKGKDAGGPAIDPQGQGLVSYLKQAHGLTKKRNTSGKATKRAAASEPMRASTSSRPILPRLELPAASVAAPPRPEPPGARRQDIAAAEAAQQLTGSRYAPIAPATAVPGARAMTLDEQRRQPQRRWPWLQPMPVTPPTEPSGHSSSASAALRSLAQMTPPVLPFAAPRSSERSAVRSSGGHSAPPNIGSNAVPGAAQPRQRQATYPQFQVDLQVGSSPSPTHHFAAPSSSPPYHHSVTAEYPAPPQEIPPGSSPTYQSPIAHELQQPGVSGISGISGVYGAQPHYGAYPYAVSPQGSQTSSPLPSPSVTATTPPGAHHAGPDDPENQPFFVTPEYEALANARFEAAVRSGAVQANMTPNVLSPVAASPVAGPGAGYFAMPHAPDPMAHGAALQHAATLSPAEYAYAAQREPALQAGHDVMHYHTAGVEAGDPAQGYYHTHHTPPGTDPSSAHPWYHGS